MSAGWNNLGALLTHRSNPAAGQKWILEFAPPQTPKGQKPVCLGVCAAWGNIVLAQRRHPMPLLAPTPQFSSPLHAFAAAHFMTGH